MLGHISGVRGLVLSTDDVHRCLVAELLGTYYLPSSDTYSSSSPFLTSPSHLSPPSGVLSPPREGSRGGDSGLLSTPTPGTAPHPLRRGPSVLLPLLQHSLATINMPLMGQFSPSRPSSTDREIPGSRAAFGSDAILRGDDEAYSVSTVEGGTIAGTSTPAPDSRDISHSPPHEARISVGPSASPPSTAAMAVGQSGALRRRSPPPSPTPRPSTMEVNEVLFGSSASSTAGGGSGSAVRLTSVRLSHNVSPATATNVPRWARGWWELSAATSSPSPFSLCDDGEGLVPSPTVTLSEKAPPHVGLSLTLLGAFLLDSLTPPPSHGCPPEASPTGTSLPIFMSEDKSISCPTAGLFHQTRPPRIVSAVTALDVTFNNIISALPRGLTRLRSAFFEYCERLEDLSALADGEIADLFVGACQRFAVFPRGLGMLRRLELNWCTYAEDLSALSHPLVLTTSDGEDGPSPMGSLLSSGTSATHAHHVDPFAQYPASLFRDGAAGRCTLPSPPLETLIINHNYRLRSLPPRMLCLTSIRLDKCEGLRSAAALSGLPLLTSIDISSCQHLVELPHWYMYGSLESQKEVEGTGASCSLCSKGCLTSLPLLPCALSRVRISETAVGDAAVARLVVSARHSLLSLELYSNGSMEGLDDSVAWADTAEPLDRSVFAHCLSFPRLHTLEVGACLALRHLRLFFPSIHVGHDGLGQPTHASAFGNTRTPSLQTLLLTELDSFEEIFFCYGSEEEGRDARTRACCDFPSTNSTCDAGLLPSLTSLSLAWCTSLPPLAAASILSGGRWDNPQRCFSICPLLQTIDLSGCYQLTRLQLVPPSQDVSGEDSAVSSTNNFAALSAACSSLEKLVIDGCGALRDGSVKVAASTNRRGGYAFLGLMRGAAWQSSCGGVDFGGEREDDEEEEKDEDEDEQKGGAPLLLSRANFPRLRELNMAGCDESGGLPLGDDLRRALSRLIE